MFGLGFTEILIIAVIAILFLGPDKLPSAMVDVAKFFRNVKRTIGDVKDSLEQEMNVSEMKEEALAYKKELLKTKNDIAKATNIGDIGAQLTNLNDDIMDDFLDDEPKKETPEKSNISDEKPKVEKVTFEKKIKREDNINV